MHGHPASLSSALDRLHLRARRNKWLGRFAVFNRIALAAGFLPSGLQKVVGERFTVLSANHPMGHYLDAFYQTGSYYTFVGLMQVTAAILLLIPRTATLGAIIYFPIILNIWVLTYAVRFDGSLLTSPLMVLAVLYLLCWDYHKLKLVLPFNRHAGDTMLPNRNDVTDRFPAWFFAGVAATVLATMALAFTAYDIRPRNTMEDCRAQCPDADDPAACYAFCDCVHLEGQPLGACLAGYDEAQ